MTNPRLLAATLLGVGFAVVSVILVGVEPGMGFTGPADYLNLDKVLAASDSTAWLVGDLVYLGFFFSLGTLALHSDDAIQRVSGRGAALLFLIIASIGRVLAYTSGLEPTLGDVSSLMSSLLPIRLAMLRATVVLLGIFAWRTTWPKPESDPPSVAARGLGVLVLAASIGFFFVFLPVPLLFAVWATWLAFRVRGSEWTTGSG